jgi:hypothetical protein
MAPGIARGSRRRAYQRPITSGFAALALAVPSFIALSPVVAQASTATLTHSLPRGTEHTDQTWSGYAVTGAGPYTKITGSWNVPTMNCSHGGGDASPWIGVDGWSNDTVEQIGVDLDCNNGVGSYHPWVEMYPGPSDYFKETINAGDTLTASVTVKNGTWTLTESDPTSGWTKTFKRTPANPPKKASAEAIVEDIGNGDAPPVPDFNTVTFSNITVDGSPLASAGNPHQTTLERGSTPLSGESALSGGNFSITWLHH